MGTRARKVGEKGPHLGKLDKSRDHSRATLGESLPQRQHVVPGERQEGLDVSDFPTTFPPGGLIFRLMTSSQSWVASLGSHGS